MGGTARTLTLTHSPLFFRRPFRSNRSAPWPSDTVGAGRIPCSARRRQEIEDKREKKAPSSPSSSPRPPRGFFDSLPTNPLALLAALAPLAILRVFACRGSLPTVTEGRAH